MVLKYDLLNYEAPAQFADSKTNIVIQLTCEIIVLVDNLCLICFVLSILLEYQVSFKINSNFCILPEQWLYIMLLVHNSQ